jgi:3-oxoacyl-(acyl-carrier-protein) synthase
MVQLLRFLEGRFMTRPVYVTGMGALCRAGTGIPALRQALYSGRRNPAPSRRLELGWNNGHPVFELEDTTPFSVWPGQTLTFGYFMAAAREALAMAGLQDGLPPGIRTGLVFGTTTLGATLPSNEARCRYLAGAQGDKPGAAEENPALAAARELGVNGPFTAVMNACASGTDALGIALEWLRGGLCDRVIAGGSDELTRISFLGFNALQIYSPEPCTPFDRNRKGLNLGEGAGVLLLESEKSLAAGGGRPLATLLGYGTACDAWHLTAPHPDAAGLEKAVASALAQGGIAAADIDYVNTHGTATPTNDHVEGGAMTRLYRPDVAVAATKSLTGHTLGAAGALEAVFTVMNLSDGKVPGTPGFLEADPEGGISPCRETVSADLRYGISHSLAFGGTNSVLLFSRGES